MIRCAPVTPRHPVRFRLLAWLVPALLAAPEPALAQPSGGEDRGASTGAASVAQGDEGRARKKKKAKKKRGAKARAARIRARKRAARIKARRAAARRAADERTGVAGEETAEDTPIEEPRETGDGAAEGGDEVQGGDEGGDEGEGADEGGEESGDVTASADDDAFNFGEAAEVKTLAPEPTAAPSPISAGGSLRTVTGAWVEKDPARPSRFAQARESVDLWARYKDHRYTLHAGGHAEYDLAYRVDREAYDPYTLDTYEYVVEPREVYANGNWGLVDATVGRFVESWGEGIVLTPLDIVNPRDQRELGLVEPDELRLPTLGTRLALSGSIHEVEVIVMHESDFGRRATPGGAYSPLPAAFPILEVRDSEWQDAQKRFDVDNQQVFGRWSFRPHQVDVRLYAASSLDQQGVAEVPPIDPASMDPIVLTVDHRRVSTYGVSGALPIGDFVFKLESSIQPKKPFNTVDPMTSAVDVTRVTAVTGMAGVNYWKAPWRVTFELAKTQLQHADIGAASSAILLTSDDPVAATRVQWDPEIGRFSATAVGVAMGKASDPAWLARLEAAFELRESLLVAAGYATYHPSREFNVLSGLDTVDRIYARLRWDFDWN